MKDIEALNAEQLAAYLVFYSECWSWHSLKPELPQNLALLDEPKLAKLRGMLWEIVGRM
jgi:hypothetical protein